MNECSRLRFTATRSPESATAWPYWNPLKVMAEVKACPTESGITMPAPKEALGWLATGVVVTPPGPRPRTAVPPSQTRGPVAGTSMAMGAATWTDRPMLLTLLHPVLSVTVNWTEYTPGSE